MLERKYKSGYRDLLTQYLCEQYTWLKKEAENIVQNTGNFRGIFNSRSITLKTIHSRRTVLVVISRNEDVDVNGNDCIRYCCDYGYKDDWGKTSKNIEIESSLHLKEIAKDVFKCVTSRQKKTNSIRKK